LGAAGRSGHARGTLQPLQAVRGGTPKGTPSLVGLDRPESRMRSRRAPRVARCTRALLVSERAKSIELTHARTHARKHARTCDARTHWDAHMRTPRPRAAVAHRSLCAARSRAHRRTQCGRAGAAVRY
jgi:hypothetical protein